MRLCFSIDVLHAFRNRKAIREADFVWTILDSEGLAIALLMKLAIVPSKPLIGNMVWAFNKWKRFGLFRRAVYRSLTRRFTALTVHSSGCLPISHTALPDVRAMLMYFGINVEAYLLTPPSTDDDAGPIRILGIGNDPSRDWMTFLEAFAGDPRFAVKLVCHHIKDKDVAQFKNVTLLRHPKMPHFRQLYEEAQYVVVPMHENIFSGITVALEGVALGKPVVCSRTGGVPTYFDEDQVIYVATEDAVAMRAAALETSPNERMRFAQRAQQRFIESDYSSDGMIARYAELTAQHGAQFTGREIQPVN